MVKCISEGVKMLKELKMELNKTKTENNDVSYKSSGNYVLDFFGLAGAMRNRDFEDVKTLFYKAWAENPQLALRAIFYFRDVRGGQGERKVFRLLINELAKNHTETMRKNLYLIPEYGRWDDMLMLFDTPLESDMFNFISGQWDADVKSEHPSLLGKWLPSENASSNQSKLLAIKIRKHLGLNSQKYRKSLSALRKKIDIVEKKMSGKEWTNIKYEAVPSKAGLLYKDAFKKHDADRYGSYIESVKKGEKKINAGALYPYEIFAKVESHYDETLNVLWNSLPDYVNKEENALVMADVSGSMNGRPMAVSVSLALYFAERNKGRFANHFMTFTSEPCLMEIKGKTLQDKFRCIQGPVGYDTNLAKALRVILNVAVNEKLSQEKLPSRLFVISDMQFNDSNVSGKSTFKVVNEEFIANGYKMPQVVFWQVDARNTQLPATKDENVVLVSGMSPVLFKQILADKSAEDVMLDILNSKRYEKIKI